MMNARTLLPMKALKISKPVRKRSQRSACGLPIILFFLLSLLQTVSFAQVKTYPQLTSIQGTQFAYTMKARAAGSTAWQNVPLYNVLVVNQSGSQVNSTLGTFDCAGPTEIQLTYSTTVTSAAVHPASLNVNAAISGNTVTFTIPGPKKFYVNINGDHYNGCFHVIAQPLEVDPPQPGDPNVVYVPSGTYNTGNIALTPGQTLYIQGGAAVASVSLANNTRVIGRGFLYRASYDAFNVSNLTDVTIDGILDLNHGWGNGGGNGFRAGQATNVTLRNSASFSSKKWGDGYNIYCSNGVTIQDCFVRTHDDAITFYGGGKSNFTGNNENITVSNCVIAHDLAQAFHVGVYGDTYATEIRNINVSNIDICNWTASSGRPAIYFTVGDEVRATNIRFNNIRVYDYVNTGFIQVSLVNNGTYNYGPGREIDGVYFTNCTYTGGHTPSITASGWNASRLVKNVFFENVVVNGSPITQSSVSTNAYTQNIVVRSSSNCPPTTLTPAVQVNGGAWQNTSSVTVNAGDRIKFGPQPTTGGTWLWTGLGTSGSPREQTFTAVSSGTATATFTSTCGTQTSIQFNVTVNSTGSGIIAGQTYKITAQHSGKSMDVNGASISPGASIIQWPDNGATNQQWVVENASSGYYKIKSVKSGLYLDINGSSSADGAGVLQWSSTTAQNQQFQILPSGNGSYTIRPRHSGKCVEVAAGSTADGANVQQWSCGGGANQNWQFTLTGQAARMSAFNSEGFVQSEKEILLEAYPNPTTDFLTLKNLAPGDVVEVYANSGRLMIQKQLQTNESVIDVRSLDTGLYIIKIKGKNTVGFKKILKK